MAVYKAKFCKIGYNDEITTSSDPEDVCTGLGLDGGGIYKFPTKVPFLISTSVYTRRFFISSSSALDTGYHEYVEPVTTTYDDSKSILINENTHGSVGAIEVKISGLNTSFGLSEEVVRLNGQTPIHLTNHYHRINDMKVVTSGRLLANQGDIYISALDGVRTSYLLELNDYVSSGVPISGQKIYAKIPGSDNRMLSSHYTVPRSHTLYVESIRLMTDTLFRCNWKLMAGVNGSLHTVYKGTLPNTYEAQALPNIEFKDGYAFPGGTDIVIRINTVGGTLDVSSIMEGYLINQIQLKIENERRLDPSVIVTTDDLLTADTYIEDDYTDEEFSDVPDYSSADEDASYDDAADEYARELEGEDEGAYEEGCEEGYRWCDVLGDCIDAGTECA